MPKTGDIPLLPPKLELETKMVLKKAAQAHRFLAELKGVSAAMPNQSILIDTLALQEARESSAIENIVSTFDDVYQSNAAASDFISPQAKEVHAYARALKLGCNLIKKNNLLTVNHIIEIQGVIENNRAGFRKLPGTKLLNQQTGATVYTPPQNHASILALMRNLEKYINDDSLSDADPLIKMAVIHHRFETIHPFYDGNGRTGRIINILYLIKNDLLNLPILYMSRYIIRHKAGYYRLLQQVRDKDDWEAWLIFMLNAVIETSRESITIIRAMAKAIQQYKIIIRTKAPKIYSQDLLNNIFRHPYTKIEYVTDDLGISRNTALRYLLQLENLNLLVKQKRGRDNYYVNTLLVKILTQPERKL